MWKPINHPILKDIYLIHHTGKIRHINKGEFRKARVNKQGYLALQLKGPNNFMLNCKVHRLVGLTYKRNPHNKPLVHHLDHNKLNNHYKNLKWVDYKTNMQAKADSFEVHPNCVPIEVLSKQGKVHSFKSLREAADSLGVP